MACPWVAACAARRDGDPERLPRKTPKAPPRAAQAVAGVVERRGRWLVVQRPPRGLLGGLWELPGGDLLPGEEPAAALSRTLRERLGICVPGGERAGEIEHVFSHLQLTLHVFRCKPHSGRVRRDGFASHRWIAPRRIGDLAIGGPTRKALRLLGLP